MRVIIVYNKKVTFKICYFIFVLNIYNKIYQSQELLLLRAY